ncbi:hypothetical protein SUGI_0332070 [Cryptomeria japonica]|nr:hypothetical protein SUGI_0332070 [Cryptomeria japonica]
MSSSIRLDGGESWTGSLRQGSTRQFERSSSVFSLSTHREDDIEALKWAAIEKLPTYDRLRTSILKNVSQNNGIHNLHEIDVRHMQLETRQQLIERLVKVADQDNEYLLQRLRQRIDRVGIKLPEVEVRFENLNVEADVHVGGRALPTLYNYAANIMEDDSGKTTLLLAFTGKLDKSLRVDGSVTFNGHNMEEFVPQRTSAYISQHDMHIRDMTVRETLDFSAHFLGVGYRYDVSTELSRPEKEEGIKLDPDIDIFMKATAMEGQKSNLITQIMS